MTTTEATWEDVSFMQKAFPEFKPWSLASRGGLCQAWPLRAIQRPDEGHAP
jgi:hypothetical protein